MNKLDFLYRVKEKYKEQTGKDIAIYRLKFIFNAFVGAAIDAIKEDGELKLAGVISMRVRNHTQRGGYDPTTGERFTYRPRNTVYCKVGRQFLRAINGGVWLPTVKETVALKEKEREERAKKNN